MEKLKNIKSRISSSEVDNLASRNIISILSVQILDKGTKQNSPIFLLPGDTLKVRCFFA